MESQTHSRRNHLVAKTITLYMTSNTKYQTDLVSYISKSFTAKRLQDHTLWSGYEIKTDQRQPLL